MAKDIDKDGGAETERSDDGQTMLCAACGARIDKDSVFCPKCGVKMSDVPSEEDAYEAAQRAIDDIETKKPAPQWLFLVIGAVILAFIVAMVTTNGFGIFGGDENHGDFIIFLMRLQYAQHLITIHIWHPDIQ